MIIGLISDSISNTSESYSAWVIIPSESITLSQWKAVSYAIWRCIWFGSSTMSALPESCVYIAAMGAILAGRLNGKEFLSAPRAYMQIVVVLTFSFQGSPIKDSAI